MTAEHLAGRDNWQTGARNTGDTGENIFANRLAQELPEKYEVIVKPKKIPIYSDGSGIKMDSAVYNKETGHILFIEKKTGERGGNCTEERGCKFLSKGVLKRVKRLFPNTSPDPFFIVFSGDIFNGKNDDLEPFYVERFDKKTSKIKKSKIKPKLYREKIEVLYEDHQFAIMDKNFSNIKEVAKQIMEIV